MNRLLPVVIEPKLNIKLRTFYPPFNLKQMWGMLIMAAAVSDMSDEKFGKLMRDFKELKEEGVLNEIS